VDGSGDRGGSLVVGRPVPQEQHQDDEADEGTGHHPHHPPLTEKIHRDTWFLSETEDEKADVAAKKGSPPGLRAE
jgi:hypothetical protein